MSGLRDSETLKINLFYCVFISAFAVGLWMFNSDGAVPYASVTAGFNGAERLLSHSHAVPPEDEPPLRTITTLEEFDAALADDRCVIFVDVDWSIDAVLARRTVVYPLVRSCIARVAPRITFFRIDATVQEGAVFDGLEASALRDAAYGGYGPLLVLRRGQLVDLVPRAASETVDALLDRIARALEL